MSPFPQFFGYFLVPLGDPTGLAGKSATKKPASTSGSSFTCFNRNLHLAIRNHWAKDVSHLVHSPIWLIKLVVTINVSWLVHSQCHYHVSWWSLLTQVTNLLLRLPEFLGQKKLATRGRSEFTQWPGIFGSRCIGRNPFSNGFPVFNVPSTLW